MTYAKVTDGTIVTIGRLPRAARRLDTGQWVLGLAAAPADVQAACGWLPLADTPRPDPNPDTVHERDVTLVDGVPTVVWTERPKTAAELFFAEQATAPDLTSALAARLTTEPSLWVQPTGAHDAYLPGQIVVDAAGDRWRNDLGAVNVWPVDNPHANWTNLDATVPVGPQPWVQPQGAHDAYPAGVSVTHNGQTWVNSHGDGNVWEPGVYGWAVHA